MDSLAELCKPEDNEAISLMHWKENSNKKDFPGILHPVKIFFKDEKEINHS